MCKNYSHLYVSMEYIKFWVYATAVVEVTCWEYKKSKEGKIHYIRHVIALHIITLMCEFLDYTLA